jgi:hypothetical protein
MQKETSVDLVFDDDSNKTLRTVTEGIAFELHVGSGSK